MDGVFPWRIGWGFPLKNKGNIFTLKKGHPKDKSQTMPDAHPPIAILKDGIFLWKAHPINVSKNGNSPNMESNPLKNKDNISLWKE